MWILSVATCSIPGRQYDLVFCQNVLIYFRAAAAEALLARFHHSLRDDGALLLGFSEAAGQIPGGFQVAELAGTYIYRKTTYNTLLPARPQQRMRPPIERQPVVPPVSPPIETAETLAAAARSAADRGELDVAVRLIRLALERDPLLRGGQLLLGSLTARLGDWTSALSTLERARYLEPASPVVSFYLATAHEQLGRRRPAAIEYRNALRKLLAFPPDAVLDGVAVSWIEASCQQRLAQLAREA
jgi:tetratricopeptide (TPR) repeat protein